MKRLLKLVLPIVLVLVLLAECGDYDDFSESPEQSAFSVSSSFSVPAAPQKITPYDQMEYQHPDLDQLRSLADAIIRLAEGNDSNSILDAYEKFYDAYEWFYTCASLADIHYSADLSSKYWNAENSFCSDAVTQVEQLWEEIYSALANSPCRRTLEKNYFGSGYFDDYTGQTYWTDELIELTNQESALIQQYYSQSAEGTGILSFLFGPDAEEMAQTLVDLIRVRHRIAQVNGYDDYESYANNYFYYRDYSAADMEAYLWAIQDELVPLYEDIWTYAVDFSDSKVEESLAYVRDAAKHMGGTFQDAFTLLESAGLYDIDYSENKYDSSFEVYLSTYQEPFIFMNPELTTSDHLTLAHEFGHFCSDYASQGYLFSIDVCEIFSQATEYLSLRYSQEGEEFVQAKLADSLCTYVEQACFASFEQQMYRIPEDQLSVQALYDLYAKTAQAYGFDAIGYEPDDFVTITHFYTNPMYVCSYIISNDAAMQIYQMELEQEGAGLRCLEKNLSTEENYFLAFLKNAGLESPFAPDRLHSVRQTFLNTFPG